MARPREFDEDEVLDNALRTFWDKGYEGTSVEDLVQSTGLGRASLYGAFGDKEQLFERVLDRYIGGVGDAAASVENEAGTAPEVLGRMLRSRLGTTCARSSPKGCFLLLAGTSGGAPPGARDKLMASLQHLERAISNVVRRGQERGEIKNPQEPLALARFLVVVLQGISSAARAGWGVDRLRVVADEALAHVVG